jgi:hypothetical protein
MIGPIVRAQNFGYRIFAYPSPTRRGRVRIQLPYTWLLLPAEIEDKSRRTALTELLRWVLTTGQEECSALGYAPLPPEVAKRALESLGAKK